jgi:hypothetical protein
MASAVAAGKALFPRGIRGELRTSSFAYENREMLKYVLNPAMLCKQIPWYENFLLDNAIAREHLRQYGISGKYDTRTRGFDRDREMQLFARIPSRLMAVILYCDPELDTNERKFEVFLKDFPEFDLRVRN